LGTNANLLRNGDEIGFMRFEKGDQRDEQDWVVRPAPQFIRPDSGQVEEPLRPALVAKRCRKRGKGQRMRISWSLVMHGLGNNRNR
jgi:hypothetical protein